MLNLWGEINNKNMNLIQYKEQLSQSQGKRSFIRSELDKTNKDIEAKQKRLHALERAQAFLQKVAQDTQEQLRFHIKDIVQLCLETVWPGEIDFDIKFEIKNGRTVAKLVFLIDGEEVEPMEADGGGLTHLAAFALRIAAWTLGATRNTIVLDEPLSALQPLELQVQGFKIIKELSEKLNLQFIIVKNSVNSGDLEEIADKVFEVKRKRIGDWYQSEVKVI